MTHSMKIAYFGYGSLVNLETLQTPYISAHRARLTGWRRAWLARPKIPGGYAPISGLAFLSAERCENTTIEGIVVVDQRSSLPSLDQREALYDRNRRRGRRRASCVPILMWSCGGIMDTSGKMVCSAS